MSETWEIQDLRENLGSSEESNEVFDKMKKSPLYNAMREIQEALGPVQLVSKRKWWGWGGSKEKNNSKEKDKPNKLTKELWRYNWPSWPETWYNLDMTNIVKDMKNRGFTEAKWYKYHLREDGVKMLGNYVMVAANLKTRPKWTILDTSLWKWIVCDTWGFVRTYPNWLDIATNWKI